jgi:branched-chain amino acid transport system substrate-binding protein
MISRRSLTGIVLGAAIGFLPLSAQSADPVRIGFSLAKTGLFADAAPSQLNAYELWREQVNAKGGLDVGGGVKRPIEFVQYDDQSNPGQAVRIYEKLITDDKVDLLLAPWGTPHHFALAPVLEKFKFPMVGNSASSAQLKDIKPGYIWFVTSAVPNKIGSELVAMLKDNNVKSVAVISSVLPFSKEIKSFLMPALAKEKIEVKVNEEYPPTTKDMTAMLTKVKAGKPDAVITLSYPSDSVLYANQAKELGIEAKFQFVLVGPTMDFYSKVVGKAANNIVTIGHWTPNRAEWTRAKPFFDSYVAKFKEAPDHLDSALAFMSCEILEQAVAKAGLNREKVKQAIASMTFDTINGPVKFTGVENSVTPTAFLQIQDNTIQLVWPTTLATAKYRPKTSW